MAAMEGVLDPYWTVIYMYCGLGGLVAFAFVIFGIDRIDAAAHGARLFRFVLLPGLTLLWPLVLTRWFVLERQRKSQQ